jgi:hypothetical protein
MSRRAGIWIAVACLVIGLTVFVTIRPTTLFDVNGTALSTSVERVINGHSAELDVAVDRCSSRGSGDWVCPVEMDPGSGASGLLTIHSDERGCWSGERLLAQVFGKSHRSAGDLTGCIRLWDYSGIAL